MSPWCLALVLFLVLGGCLRAPRQGEVSPTEPVPSTLNKTFGSIESGNGLRIQYKSLSVRIDPPVSLGAATQVGAPPDLVIFTSPIKNLAIGNQWTQSKVLVNRDAVAALGNTSHADVKELPLNRKIIFKKSGHFFFLSAFQGRNSQGFASYGFLFEFDNGRNVLVINGVTEEAALRTSLYACRDDGKEIDSLVYSSLNPNDTAKVAGLFQPKELLLWLPDKVTLPVSFNKEALSPLFQENFFTGSWQFLSPGKQAFF